MYLHRLALQDMQQRRCGALTVLTIFFGDTRWVTEILLLCMVALEPDLATFQGCAPLVLCKTIEGGLRELAYVDKSAAQVAGLTNHLDPEVVTPVW